MNAASSTISIFAILNTSPFDIGKMLQIACFSQTVKLFNPENRFVLTSQNNKYYGSGFPDQLLNCQNPTILYNVFSYKSKPF